jgi:hypothetical protein
MYESLHTLFNLDEGPVIRQADDPAIDRAIGYFAALLKGPYQLLEPQETALSRSNWSTFT